MDQLMPSPVQRRWWCSRVVKSERQKDCPIGPRANKKDLTSGPCRSQDCDIAPI